MAPLSVSTQVVSSDAWQRTPKPVVGKLIVRAKTPISSQHGPSHVCSAWCCEFGNGASGNLVVRLSFFD